MYMYIEHFQHFPRCIDSYKIWYPDVKSNNKTTFLINLFLYWSYFWNKLISYEIEHKFFPPFCVSAANRPISAKFSDTLVKLKMKIFCRQFFYLVHNSRTWKLFSNFEYYILNTIFPSRAGWFWKKKLSDSYVILKKEIIWSKNIFHFIRNFYE